MTEKTSVSVQNFSKKGKRKKNRKNEKPGKPNLVPPDLEKPKSIAFPSI
jgi:hypothetical protein